MSLILVAALSILPVQEPRNDAQCYNSVRRLGTDNVPLDDSLRHSVVNVWAFIGRGEAQPIAFLYKNYSSEYYLEFTNSMREALARSWGIPSKFLIRPHSGVNFAPQRVSADEMLKIEQVLLSHNAVLAGCFAHDLRMVP